MFEWTMRKLPKIMSIVALFYYVGSVITLVAASEQGGVFPEYAPLSATFRTFVMIFLQPMYPALLLLAAAAALWRFDRLIEARGKGTAE